MADTHTLSAAFGRDHACSCEHLLEVYKDEEAFLERLSVFIGEGIGEGEGIVVIATPEHHARVDARLRANGYDAEHARASGFYLSLDAAGTLARFMVDGRPDEARFEQVIGEALDLAGRDGRAVRAFGEMVALLWGEGQLQATLRLEQLWNDLIARRKLLLLCAYPRTASIRDITDDFAQVCAEHSQVAFT